MDMTEVTKERRAELLALFKEELGIGKPKAKPKVVHLKQKSFVMLLYG